MEYVKVNAVIEAVKPVAVKLPTLTDDARVVDGKPAVSVREAILALPVIDEFSVRKRIGGSCKHALVLLEQLRAEGAVKTKAEAIAELAPKEI